MVTVSKWHPGHDTSSVWGRRRLPLAKSLRLNDGHHRRDPGSMLTPATATVAAAPACLGLCHKRSLCHSLANSISKSLAGAARSRIGDAGGINVGEGDGASCC